MFTFSSSFTLQATAQILSPCVEQCALQALPEAGCDGLSDLQCVCSNASSKNLVYECLQESCPNELYSGKDQLNSACMGYTIYSSTASSNYTDITSTPSTGYSTSPSAMNSSYTSTVPPRSSSGHGTSSPPAPASTSFTGAADRNAVLPVAFIAHVVAMVAMTMLQWNKSGMSD